MRRRWVKPSDAWGFPLPTPFWWSKYTMEFSTFILCSETFHHDSSSQRSLKLWVVSHYQPDLISFYNQITCDQIVYNQVLISVVTLNQLCCHSNLPTMSFSSLKTQFSVFHVKVLKIWRTEIKDQHPDLVLTFDLLASDNSYSFFFTLAEFHSDFLFCLQPNLQSHQQRHKVSV